MPRRTTLALLALEPGPVARDGQEWTVTFQLGWGDDRRPLPVVVRAPDREVAEARARQALADHLIELAGRVVRASLPCAALPPRLARPGFLGWRPSPALRQV